MCTDSLLKRRSILSPLARLSFVLLLLLFPSGVFAANDGFGTATPLTPGTPATDSISSTQADHYFSFQLTSAANVTVDFSHVPFNDVRGYWKIELLRPSDTNSFLYFSVAGNATPVSKQVALPPGTYYLKVSKGDLFSTAPFDLTVSATTGDFEQEFNDDPSTATPMALATVYTGSIQLRTTGSDPADYYRLQLPAAGNLSLRVTHSLINDVRGFWQVQLLDSTGTINYLAFDIAGNAADVTKQVALPAGDYLVKVSSSTLFTDQNYSLTASVTAGGFEQEFNDTQATANRLPLGTPLTGNISRRAAGIEPADVYTFDLAAPANVAVSIKHAIFSDSRNYWKITLTDASGGSDLLAFSSAGSVANVVKQVALPAGSYYVTITPALFSDINYELTVATTAGAFEQEFNDDQASANAIELGTSYTGSLQTRSTDIDPADYYRFVVPAAGNVTVDFGHAAISDSRNFWQVTLFRGAETDNLLTIPVPGNRTTIAKEVALPAGTYYLKVAQADVYSDGNYTVTVTHSAGSFEEEFNDTLATANPMTPGGTYSGSIQYRATGVEPGDNYRFTLAAQGNATITFKHDTISDSRSFWRLQLLDATGTGTLLAFDVTGNETNSSKQVALPAGSYYLVVTAADLHSDIGYDLSVALADGSFEQEFNDGLAAANPLNLGTTYTGSIQNRGTGIDPADYYTFTLEAAGGIDVSFSHAPISDARTYWQVSLLDVTGTLSPLTFTSTGNSTGVTKQVGLPAGTYFIKVEPAALYSDINYDLTVAFSSGTFEQEFNDDRVSATPILSGNTYTGSLQNRGALLDLADVYAISLPQPSSLTVSFKHLPIADVRPYWQLEVIDPSGASAAPAVTVPGSASVVTKQFDLPAGTFALKVAASTLYSDASYDLTASSAPDTTPPVTAVTCPPAFTSQQSGSVGFSSSEYAAAFACKSDGGAFVACQSPFAYANLPDGSHAVTIRGTDAAGNVETSPPTCAFTVDTVPPTGTLTINSGAAATTSRNVSLAVTADETVGGTVCLQIYPFICGAVEMQFSNDGVVWSGWEAAGARLWQLPAGNGIKTVLTRLRDRAQNVALITPKTITLNDPTQSVKLAATGKSDLFYQTISTAFSSFPGGTPWELMTELSSSAESPNLNRCNETVTIRGRYTTGFASYAGAATVIGSVTVTCGTLVVDGLTVQ